MAREQKKTLKTKEELLAEITLSRQALFADLPELANRCNPATRLRRSFSKHPVEWLAASTVAGLVATKLLLSRRGDSHNGDGPTGERKHRAGLRLLPILAFLLKSTWTVAEPAARKVVRDHVSRLVDEGPGNPPDNPRKETA